MAQEATQAAPDGAAAPAAAVTYRNGATQARRRKLVIAILAVFLLAGAAYLSRVRRSRASSSPSSQS